MNNFALDVPINSVSFGQVSVSLIREMFSRGIEPNIFPMHGVDLSSQKHDEEFNKRLNQCVNSALVKHKRSHTSIKLWHIVNSLSTFSNKSSRLITFFELDQLTPHETNILKNQDIVYVTSNYTKSVFEMFGIKSVYLPLGFDSHNFKQLENRPKIKDEISFLMAGKYERRKGHPKILNLWAKKYGNKQGYKLNCSISNPFLKPEDLNNLIGQALEGKQYWNINFIPWSPLNEEYNKVLQSSDIVFALSGGEGRDLCAYHATALGAWPIALKAHAYLDYLNDDNSVLVTPCGKVPVYDGIFFHQGQPVNQGNIFDFSEDDFNAACDKAESNVKNLGVNTKGLELQKTTYKEAVDILLKDI